LKDLTRLVDLASERLGGRVLAANDEFFAPKENLLKAAKAVFVEDKYTSRGKWMDGWETRRRREAGHDWCIVRMGLAGIVRGIVVDTSHFKGNFPEHCSVEGCEARASASVKQLQQPTTGWFELLPKSALQGDTQNLFAVEPARRVTHLRLNIYPDGGVARLRAHGEVAADESQRRKRAIDLAAVENGTRVLASSDEFFGSPLNLLLPGRAKNMGDGWETRRRRGPGSDWVILKLGIPGTIRRVEVDTSHFKGNFPESCALSGCRAEGADDRATALPWKEILTRTRLKANTRHVFRKQLTPIEGVTHVRFEIFPDGGVSRLRLFGAPMRDLEEGLRRLNALPEARARAAFFDCCGCAEWGRRMAARRPFHGAAKLFEAADKTWSELGRKEWLEAFRHHPPIGGRTARGKQSAAARRWSAKEQSAAKRAPRSALEALAEANHAYESHFGYIFIVCAAGRGGEEIVANLKERLGNDAETELQVAAEEQRKITRLRLEKLIEP
jgi:allantoicase